MKQLTDKEIVKALECCSTHDISCECCPLYCAGANCSSFELHKLTLDLVKRQKAEIEELKKVNYQYDYDNRKLREKLLVDKTEAYKEFAKKFVDAANIKTKALGSCHYSKTYEMGKKVFDALLKEMVGDKQ